MTTILSPRQTFEDNMRPAELLLQVYRLLESSDDLTTRSELLSGMRRIVGAPADEQLMLISNEIFLGLVRERANLPTSALRRATLCHLLRQAIVASCTALESYLPALLRANLPAVIRAKGRDFALRGDRVVAEYFADLQFRIDEVLRLLGDQNAADYVAYKILGLANFKYLSSQKGVHVTGCLLGVPDVWAATAKRLGRDRQELTETLETTVARRNDIVHRADRKQSDPSGPPQDISYSWTHHAVDTNKCICLAVDELVADQVRQLCELAGT